MNAQKLQSSVESARQLVLLVEDRDHQISADGDPYLSLHRIGAGAVVVLDAQVPLDPAEEQLDAPSHLVKHGHCEGWYFQVVGQEDELLAGFCIVVSDFPKENGKGLPGLGQSWLSNMIAAQTGEPVHRHRVVPGELEVALCPCHEEGSRIGYQNKPREVHVAAIHQIEGSCFEEKAVEPAHVVLPRPGNGDAGWYRPTQVDLGVDLDTRLGLPKVGPWKQSQRQVDRRGIQGVDRIVQIQAEILSGIQRPGFAHQTFGEILPDTPVPALVGIGESRFGNWSAETKMIECFGPGVEAGRDVAQPVPGSHLGENHTGELLTESKMANRERGLVSLYYAVERLAVDQVENLGENEAAGVHGRKFWKMPPQSSNPSHSFLPLIDSFEMPSRNSNSI